jgi:hypothetical protein
MGVRVWSRELLVMRILIAVTASIAVLCLVAAVMAPSAQAQGKGRRGQSSAASSAGAKTNKADEKAYKDALKSIPEKKVDPWGNMR